MPIKERIDNVAGIRQWKDKIPFRYEYTAGIAGERFLRGLIEGKIIGSKCERCKITYLPPKAYCTNCFGEISDFVDVGRKGRIQALSRSSVNEGKAAKVPRVFGYVSFEGVKGGIVHNIISKAPRIGRTVVVRFKPREQRKGSITDIRGFEITT